jgi:hypothetical protein
LHTLKRGPEKENGMSADRKQAKTESSVGRTGSLGRLDREQLRGLAEARPGPMVSIYLPLRASFPGVRENPVRYRHAIESVAERLIGEGLSRRDAAGWADRLGEVDTDVRQLQHPLQGLALFLDRSELCAYPLVREISEHIVVGSCFALRPLIRELQLDQAYQLIALSTNRVAFFNGDARGLQPVQVEGLPGSLEEALGSELVGREIFFRTPGSGAQGSVYQGQGGGREVRDLDLERFYRVLWSALRGLSETQDPIVLATDSTHDGAFRKIVRLPTLLPETLAGNPDLLSAQGLHERAWPLVQAARARRDRELADGYERARNRGKTVGVLDDVAMCAVTGRIHRLWVLEEACLPGDLDRATGRIVQPSNRSGDVLDAITAIVLCHAGEVFVVDEDQMPEQTVGSAELR